MASAPAASSALPLLLLALHLLLPLPAPCDARPPPPLHAVRPLAFRDGYAQIFGSDNLALLRDGRRVRIALDQTTGAGFASRGAFLHGFFGAAIRLPRGHAAGVVVAFYLSNADAYARNHDELDFEFLGNVRGREWRVQTNVYGNGSTAAGREERYALPFDPTADFHHYSILWTKDRVVFYVDETPIREVARTPALGAAFPSKPMTLYATIWDGSAWATRGGRDAVDYARAPFRADFAGLRVRACPAGAGAECGALEALEVPRAAMAAFRRAHTSYSYCHDRRRYPVALPECGAGGGREEGARLFGADGTRLQRRRRRSRPAGRRGARDDVM